MSTKVETEKAGKLTDRNGQPINAYQMHGLKSAFHEAEFKEINCPTDAEAVAKIAQHAAAHLAAHNDTIQPTLCDGKHYVLTNNGIRIAEIRVFRNEEAY